MIYPEPLRAGDKITIISPASAIKPERVDGAVDALMRAGYRVEVKPCTRGKYGTYSAPFAERTAQFADALLDPETKAILCSRGGYGCVQMLESLAALDFAPKWLVGYSDVSALHAFMASRGLVSIHGSMAKILAEQPLDFPPTAKLLEMLSGRRPGVEFPTAEGSRIGVASGPLLGGNLAVVQALIGTPYDIFRDGAILFVEDITEPIYKVERIMYQLRLAGILDRINGLIFGRFVDYKPDANHETMEQMLRDFLDSATVGSRSRHIPVAFGAPIGHFDGNMPLLYNAEAILTVTPNLSLINYL